jgi:ketosteroid isomerase-like protein
MDRLVNPLAHEASVKRIVGFFEAIAPADLQRLDAIYAPQARFRDPFNDVQGIAGIERVFAHMFATLDAPRFVVTSRVLQGDACFLVWEFHFRFRGRGAGPQVVHGGTHLLLAPDGRITLHRDYWDAAQELYEKLPVLGSLMRWLRRRLRAA